MCVRGASALDSLLAEFPEADLRAQIIWEPVLLTDVAPPLTRVLAMVEDRSATQYWDPGRIVSTELVRAARAEPGRYRVEREFPPGFIAWDVVLVYDRDALWESEPPVPRHYDDPVVAAIDSTREALHAALDGGAAAR